MNTVEEIKKIQEKLKRINELLMNIRASAGNHNLLSTVHSDTDGVGIAQGDIIIRNAAGFWANLALGAVVGQVLRVGAGGLPEWGAPGAISDDDLAFIDNFGDASRYWAWYGVNESAQKTITEAAGVQSFHIDNATQGRIDTAAYSAPSLHIGLPGFPCIIETKMSVGEPFPDYAGAGIGVMRTTGTAAAYIIERLRYSPSAIDGLRVERTGTGLFSNGITTNPIWLRIRITALSRYWKIFEFLYSTDGINWTSMGTDTNTAFNESYGWTAFLYVRNAGAVYPQVDADFEYFKAWHDRGPG